MKENTFEKEKQTFFFRYSAWYNLQYVVVLLFTLLPMETYSHKLFRFSSMSIFVIKGMILLDLGTAVQWPMIARAVNNYLPWDDRNVLQPLDVFQAH